MCRDPSVRLFRSRLQFTGLCCIASIASPLAAQERNFAFGVEQEFRHEDNVYRARSGEPRTSDMHSATQVNGLLTVPLGRQQAYALGNVTAQRYRSLEMLDHVGHDLDVGLRWATVGRLAGKVNFASSESLAPYGGDAGRRTTARNLIRGQQVNALAQMGLITQWTAEASAQRRRIDYSAPEYANLNIEQDQVGAALRFQPSPALNLGVGVRRAEGRYPQYRLDAPGVFTEDRYSRNDVDLLATWKPSGRSTFVGRLSYGRQSHREATQRSFKGTTGALSWAYQPTGKLRFNTTVLRDTGAETRFADSINPASAALGSDISRVSNGLQLAAQYDATTKLQFNGAFNRTDRSLVNVAGGAASAPGTDATRVLKLSARYSPNRNWALECGVQRESRQSDTGLSYSYNANAVHCSAEFLVY